MLGYYVDDAFGGEVTASLIDFFSNAGSNLAAVVNAAKTKGKAKSMVILNLEYCAVSKLFRLDPAKIIKYTARILDLLFAG